MVSNTSEFTFLASSEVNPIPITANKSARREVAQKSAVATKASPSGTPQFKNAVEAYNYHKARSK